MNTKDPKVLLVEDDPNLGQILTDYLEAKGYDTVLKEDGEAGYAEYRSESYDLCIFDVMIPKIDGFSLAEKIRKADSKIPIIFLTGKSLKEDIIEAFKIGADDYITKPFSMEELLYRIKAILRRSGRKEDALDTQIEFSIGRFTFRSDIQTLTRDDGEEQRLSLKESDLLRELCIYKNEIMDRSKALKKIWFDDNYFNSRSMDVYITKIRKLLKSDKNLEIINVHGQGFKLIELKP